MTENLPTFRGRVPAFVARIATTERLKNSVNGNGRWRLTFTGTGGMLPGAGVYVTEADSSVSYDVENFSGYRPPLVAVWLTPAGKVEAMTRVSA